MVNEGEQMFYDDTETLTEFLDTRVSSDSLMPEKRLMSAVLEDALGLLKSPVPKDEQAKARFLKELAAVRAWFGVRSDRGLFSFASICDHLDMDAQYLRKRLAGLVEGISAE